jgi:hypothetical protein
MVGGTYLRFLTASLALTLLALALAPCSAQLFFDDRSQNYRQRGLFNWFEPAPPQPEQHQHRVERAPPPVDYSKAPAPKPDPKAESAVTIPILVLGDSMADWLGYGLELAYADSPEIAILRQHRTDSGLIRTEVRSDPRGEYPDWPQAVRELIAAQKPKLVVMMVGINDRRQFRERGQTTQDLRAAKPTPQWIEDSAALEVDRSAGGKPNETPAVAPESARPASNRSLEFRTGAWSEAYIRRIDDTITALKTSGVPVFWVGLPPLRGQKSASDIPFLNDLYRSRADKAGIIYIDLWDGFVDEDGRFAQSGPDVQGQTRRLRTSDGVYFTQAGARKLAHYVEREVQRWLTVWPGPVAVATPEEPRVEAAAAGSGRQARPLTGPAVPLTAEHGNETDGLLDDNGRQLAADAMVTKVLVRGEAVTAPAGRADDFVWPRRGVAPFGSDPVVATTDLPMTPMVAARGATTQSSGVATAAALPATQTAHRRVTPRTSIHAYAQSMYRGDYRRSFPPQFNFQSLFGSFGSRW